MKYLYGALYQVDQNLAKRVAYVLRNGVTIASPNPIQLEIARTIKEMAKIQSPKVSIKKRGDKQIYRYTHDDAIFQISQNGGWAYLVALPHVPSKGFEEIDVREGAVFLRSGTGKDFEGVCALFRKALNQAMNFLRIRKIKLDPKGNIVPLSID